MCRYLLTHKAGSLFVSEKMIVFLMGTDKVPDHSIAYFDTYCRVVESDAHRIDGFYGINTLEMKARIVRIYFPQAICSPCLFLYSRRQTFETFAKAIGKFAFHSSPKPPSSVSLA